MPGTQTEKTAENCFKQVLHVSMKQSWERFPFVRKNRWDFYAKWNSTIFKLPFV